MEPSYRNNPKSLFRKYAKLMVWFANTDIGRNYLSECGFKVPKDPIALVTPNGFHVFKGWKDERTAIIQATFTTKDVYTSKLYGALRVLDRVHIWLNDMEEARLVLLGQLGLIPWSRQPIAFRQRFSTTTTFNPNPSTTVDGWVAAYKPAGLTWANIRTGSGAESIPLDYISASGFMTLLQNGPITGDSYQELVRNFTLFDTSSLNSAATISAATWSGYTEADKGDDAGTNGSVVLVSSSPASNTVLATGDYTAQGSTAFCTPVDFGSISLNAYLDLTMNASGIAAISLTGITKLGTTLEADRANSAPTNNNANAVSYIRCTMSEGTNKPKLTVTYDYINYLKERPRNRWDFTPLSLG